MIAKTGIRAVAYYRMSSDKQEKSIPEQVKAVERYAAENGFEILRDYLDESISGDATERRAAFLQMREDCKLGEFEVILCWDQDRFGRFDQIDAGYWIKPIRDAGVRLATVAQGEIDWETFEGNIVFAVNTGAKHAFLRDLSRNVIRGHVAGALEGKWGGGHVPYGYALQDGRLVTGDAAEIKIIRWLFREYLDGDSLRGLAEKLNVRGVPSPYASRQVRSTAKKRPSGKWSVSTVQSILTRQLYTGTYVWNQEAQGKYHRVNDGQATRVKRGDRRGLNDESEWVVIPNNHPALIDESVFEEVQRRLSQRKGRSSPHRNGGNFIFTGLLRCDHCGSAMHGGTEGGRQYYTCSGYRMRGASFCQRYAVNQREITGIIVAKVQDVFLKPSNVARLRKAMMRQVDGKSHKADLKRLKGQQGSLNAKLEKAIRRLVEVDADMVPIIQIEVRRLRGELETVRRELSVVSIPPERLRADQERRIERATEYFGDLQTAFERANPATVRRLLGAALERVDLRFRCEPWGKRTRRRLESGMIHLRPAEVLDLSCSTGHSRNGSSCNYGTSGT